MEKATKSRKICKKYSTKATIKGYQLSSKQKEKRKREQKDTSKKIILHCSEFVKNAVRT